MKTQCSTPLHQPNHNFYDSSSSYGPEGSAGDSSCGEPSNDDYDDSSLSGLEEACTAIIVMEFKAVQSDKRSSYNRAQLLSKESKRAASSFKHTVGEMVSYGGRKATLDS